MAGHFWMFCWRKIDMAAAVIEMNEPVHRSTCRVLYGDTDSGGVVYYANYLRYFEQGRTEFMRDHLFSYQELEERGYILPVVECYSRYKASAVYDDLLVIETSVAEVKPVSCRFNYRILRQANDKLLAIGHTLHAAIDRKGKLTRLPIEVVDKLRALAGQ
jgi:acyl-CoA thioester hydrolase